MKIITEDNKETRVCDVCTYQFYPKYNTPAIGYVELDGFRYDYCSKHEVEALYVAKPDINSCVNDYENVRIN